MWWHVLLGAAAGLLVVWAVLLALLWRPHGHTPDSIRLRDALRLVPDVVRLLRRLTADPALPRSVRIRLWLPLIPQGQDGGRIRFAYARKSRNLRRS